jgi:hypothetical protein
MKLKISFLFLLICQLGVAQKYKLGAVTSEELKEKTHPKDTTAVGAFLFKTGKTHFTATQDGKFELITEVFIKIKIYKKEGFGLADRKIAYYTGGSGNEKVFISDAYTYNLVGNKVEKTKLKAESQFKEATTENWSVKKITFPNVKEGSIIEYSYKIVSPYVHNFSDWVFQYKIPVNYVEYQTYIPEILKYRTVISGFEKIQIEEKVVLGNDFNSIKYTYIGNNIPGQKEEAFVRNIENYTSILKYELAAIEYKNQPAKNLSLTWADVARTIYENPDFGEELEFRSYFEDEVATLINKTMSDTEKMTILFEYVQKNMNWNEKESIYCDLGVKKAFKQKVGNTADINLMLVAMLRHAGLNANPVILSTRGNGIPVFPSRSAFNYVIAAVRINGSPNQILLDASSKNTVPTIIPIKALNWEGKLLLPKGESVSVYLDPEKHSTKSITILAKIVDTNTIEGKLRETADAYHAYLAKTKYSDLPEKTLQEDLEKKYEGVEIEQATFKKETAKPTQVTFSFTSDNAIETIGDKLYVSPLLFLGMDENPFQSETRNFSIEFDFIQKNNYTVSVKIPDDYEVESFPQPLLLQTDAAEINYSFKGSETNGMLQIMSSFEINTSILEPSSYEMLRSFFKEIINKESEKIVLKKKK